MFGLFKKKDNLETAGRKAFLSYLATIARQRLIQWSSDHWNTTPTGCAVTVRGQHQNLSINLEYLKPGLGYTYNGDRFCPAKFRTLSVSLEGNGMLELDRQSAPKGFWGLDGNIDSLMNCAESYLRKAEDSKERSESQSKIQKAEQSAKEILGHLSTDSAS